MTTHTITRPTPATQKRANIIARKEGYGSATSIVRGDVDAVIDRTPYGYRKYTTGEYVPNAYLHNFGWKNTYYQQAETVVSLTNPEELDGESYVGPAGSYMRSVSGEYFGVGADGRPHVLTDHGRHVAEATACDVRSAD